MMGVGFKSRCDDMATKDAQYANRSETSWGRSPNTTTYSSLVDSHSFDGANWRRDRRWLGAVDRPRCTNTYANRSVKKSIDEGSGPSGVGR